MSASNTPHILSPGAHTDSPPRVPVEHRLTDDERIVLDHLAEAWNAFVKLPTQHPNHGTEFAGFIHNAQRMIMSRVVARQEGWVKTDSGDRPTI